MTGVENATLTVRDIAKQCLPLFGEMPLPVVQVKSKPNWDGKEIICGKFLVDPDPRILISYSYYQETTRKDLIDTIKHELVHAWLYFHGQDISHKNPDFARKCASVGVDMNSLLSGTPDIVIPSDIADYFYKPFTIQKPAPAPSPVPASPEPKPRSLPYYKSVQYDTKDYLVMILIGFLFLYLVVMVLWGSFNP